MHTIEIPRQGRGPLLYPTTVLTGIGIRGQVFRHRVTVEQWARRPDDMIDLSAYLYNSESHELGVECWRTIDSLDPWLDETHFDLWFASGSIPQTVAGSFPIYVSATIFERLAAIVEMDSWDASKPSSYLCIDREKIGYHAQESMRNWFDGQVSR